MNPRHTRCNDDREMARTMCDFRIDRIVRYPKRNDICCGEQHESRMCKTSVHRNSSCKSYESEKFKKLDFRVVRGICRERVQAMTEEWSRRDYAIVPSIYSSGALFDRKPLYVMKKSNIFLAWKMPVNDAPIQLGKNIKIHKFLLFDLQRASQSPQCYSSAIPDNTPGFIWDKRLLFRLLFCVTVR